MCWSNKNIKMKKAKRDIKTKKVVEKIINKDSCCYKSLYYGYLYERNIKTPNININPIKNPGITEPLYKITKGYHSYTNKIITTSINPHYIEIYNKNKFLDYFSLLYKIICVVDCIIPKGTKYYLNNDGEYVSETIIVL